MLVYARSVFRPIVGLFMFVLCSVLVHRSRSSFGYPMVIYVPAHVKYSAAQAIS